MEFKKSNRNNALINDLVTRSFAFRRAKSIEKSYDLPILFNHFPLRQEPDQVHAITQAGCARGNTL